MDFLENNQKIRAIPSDINGICNGIITSVNTDSFAVLFDEGKRSKQFSTGNFIEIIIPTTSCVVRFEAEVLRIDNNQVVFSIPKEYKCVQRREYTRVNIDIPVDLQEMNNSDHIINSKARNLSAGGMQVSSKKMFENGTLLKAKFTILDKKRIETIIEILRSEENNQEYFLSGQFKEISSSDRTALIQLCFKRQLELKCKGVKSQ